jgi:eukaryotic-like serine/threonine-protein kinase
LIRGEDAVKSKRWSLIEQLFNEASELEPGERLSFLEQACHGDHALREEVLSLLRSHDEANDQAEEAVYRKVIDALAASPESDPVGRPLTGKVVGSYRLGALIDSGGMGAIYEAERADEEFKKRVAVKLIKGGVLTEGSLKRFMRERQVLADLEHPNIARLIDGGTTLDGQPYLVMEKIDGKPIDRWCDEKRLPLRERLALFGQVCSAVLLAHRNLTVHRDIKPANILVTEDGTAKLLDFGIAKILEPDTKQTATQERLLTPGFASPEQLTGQPITTSSDIYSLGVLLYHLLTGHTPFWMDDKPAHENVRMVCEDEPTRPSDAVCRISDGEDSSRNRKNAINRRSRPEKLKKLLAGDLDNIILMAMRKEPDRRYQSVEQLSADLKRHLDGLPVLAHKDTFRYRTVKFIKRNRTGVVAAALVFLALSVGLASAGFGLATASGALSRERLAHSQEKKAKKKASREAERARTEAAIHRHVSDFLIETFQSTDPARTRGASVTAKEILENGARIIMTSLEKDPLIRAHVMKIIGTSLVALSQYSDAEPLLEGAVEGFLEHECDSEAAVKTLINLAVLRRLQSRYKEALSLLEEALNKNRSLNGDHHELTYSCIDQIGLVQTKLGRFKEALGLLEGSLDGRTRLSGADCEESWITLSHLANLYRELGWYAKAEPLFKKVLESHTSSLGTDHPHTLLSMDRLASLYHKMGRYSEAETLYLELLETRNRVLGPNHQSALNVLNSLSSLFSTLGRYEEADALFDQYWSGNSNADPKWFNGKVSEWLARKLKVDVLTLSERAVEARRRDLGDDHPRTLTAIHNHASIYYDRGQFDECRRLYEKAVEDSRRKLGDDHPTTLFLLYHLANLYDRLDEVDKSASLFEEIVEGCRTTLLDQHITTLSALRGLGKIRIAQQRHGEAEDLLKQALKGALDSFGENHPLACACYSSLALSKDTQGKKQEALQLYEKAYGLAVRKLGKTNHTAIILLKNVIQCCISLHDARRAKQFIDRADRILLETAQDHPEFVFRLKMLGPPIQFSVREFRDREIEELLPFSGGKAGGDGRDDRIVFRDDDGTAEKAFPIDYHDDGLAKTIRVDVDPQKTREFRLWIHGQAFNSKGKSFVSRNDFRILVNSISSQQIYFDVNEAFGDETGAFVWACTRIPNEWLIRGDNTFMIFHVGPIGSWDHNNLRVGIDRDHDVNRSACDNNSYPPSECQGELMIYLDALQP